ncbi:MAG TPA: hypothetical protein VL361_26545 [Candidatus Limnocylindrales bacterium]|nr:hypothetical protein [Candidatus Limnocylindrales bacterium]
MRRIYDSLFLTASNLAVYLSIAVSANSLTPSSGADIDLLPSKSGFDLEKILRTDAKISLIPGAALRVETGHEQSWPGVTLPCPSGSWDLSAYAAVAVTVRNSGTNEASIYCRIDNPRADGTDHCVTASMRLAPGAVDTISVPLKRAAGDNLNGTLFGMRGYPVAVGGSGTVDPTNITQLLIFVSKPSADHSFEIRQIQARGTYVAPTACISDAADFFPFIDELGQYRHKSWPDKAHTAAELNARRESEKAELQKHPGPPDWDKYGGWKKGPSLNASGFFRTQKVSGKWWLVDPEGRLFFSHGIDCVGMLDSTPIDQRDTWFEHSPAAEPLFASFLSSGRVLKGHYAGRNPRSFSFAGANLSRKYGKDWSTIYPQVIHQRLRSWGLNTIGNWSDQKTVRRRQTPYTDAIGSSGARMIQGSEGYWGKFPDVFDPSFAAGLRRGMERKKATSASDPWCIGYFSDNEMSWGDELSLAFAALRSPADQACKRAFVDQLKVQYGEISNLNSAWATTNESWQALLENREPPSKEKAEADLGAFYTRIAEQYFKTVRDTIKAVAPNQLYLGCRFAWVNARAAAAAAKYCDVVSYNLYRRSVADFQFNGGADVPLLIGEFHFGALDRGMFHTGLVPVADQNARANAYIDYVRGALHHPQFVGCHWFQYQDEPVTGRVYDEENYQIGFVDIADTPYAETIAASRKVGYSLYGQNVPTRP